MARMQSGNIQDMMLAQQIFNQAIQNSDYYAQFYPGSTDVTTPGTNASAVAPLAPGQSPLPGGTASSTNPSTYGYTPGQGVRF